MWDIYIEQLLLLTCIHGQAMKGQADPATYCDGNRIQAVATETTLVIPSESWHTPGRFLNSPAVNCEHQRCYCWRVLYVIRSKHQRSLSCRFYLSFLATSMRYMWCLCWVFTGGPVVLVATCYELLGKKQILLFGLLRNSSLLVLVVIKWCHSL